MRICAYLNFKGQARAAMEFYAGIFNTKPEFMTYAEVPPTPEFPVSEEMKKLIMHAEVFISEGQSIMLGDDIRPGEGVMGNAFSLALMTDYEDKHRRVFTALSEGGKVLMPLSETFWSPSFGSVQDRFGVIWHLNLCQESGCSVGALPE